MKDFILLMHDDTQDSELADDSSAWAEYSAGLQASGRFDGGSSIGSGRRFKRQSEGLTELSAINGFLRVRATSIEEAEGFLAGNPVYEAGGTVELRELLKD